MEPAEPKLLDQVRALIRTLHYSIRTEEAYVNWIRRFILFHKKRHPAQMGKAEIEAFLTHLAVNRKVAASTQSQAKAALLFLYHNVLRLEVEWLKDIVAAKQPQRLPTVLTIDETRTLLSHMKSDTWLVASLLYGSGLRLMEACRLRVLDIDFNMQQIEPGRKSGRLQHLREWSHETKIHEVFPRGDGARCAHGRRVGWAA